MQLHFISAYCDRTYGGGPRGADVAVTTVAVRVYIHIHMCNTLCNQLADRYNGIRTSN
jgi:hypothetical protein